MTHAESGRAAGPWAPLTRLVGRERELAAVTELLREHRLVTLTGPGGVGKTRLAVEAAQAAADGFPDGTFFVGLGTVADPARVAGEVAASLGVREVPGQPTGEVLAEVLAPRQLLVVLDNCEHVLDAVAKLCGELLNADDDVRILATSREQLWVGGEARYRLTPLALPRSDDPGEISRSEAVALFAERVSHAVPGFALSAEDAPLAARVAARLDGMPLAIELAAARVKGLGLAGLADRIDDALQLLTSKNAAVRHQSLAAVADWSHQLLSAGEQAVFRRLAAFPGPFTLEAATAVAGPGAEPAVLRLVDCSLLVPPRPGPDGRVRYTMLETLRAYGLDRLAKAGEEEETAAALAGFALSVAGQAGAGLETDDRRRELDALRLLDAEDATLHAALRWALARDPGAALALATALAPWWLKRGRITEGYAQLAAAAGQAAADGPAWPRAQLWLGYLVSYLGNHADSVTHYAAAHDAAAGSPAPRVAIHALAGRALAEANLGHLAEGAHLAREALTLARGAGDQQGETDALTSLAITAYYREHMDDALAWIRQAQESLTTDTPGYVARLCRAALATVLFETGDFDSARSVCVEALARSREAGDLIDLATMLTIGAFLEDLAGNPAESRTYLHEAVVVAARTGDHLSLVDCIQACGFLCAATGHWAEAVTLWAAYAAEAARAGTPERQSSKDIHRREEYLRRITAALSPAQVRAAEDRGSRMTLAAAAEFATMLTAPREATAADAASQLSARERELVTLVARGHTNTQIAERLHISVRTVASHLDRIRDKTGHRRRADLTRLALEEKLV